MLGLDVFSQKISKGTSTNQVEISKFLKYARSLLSRIKSLLSRIRSFFRKIKSLFSRIKRLLSIIYHIDKRTGREYYRLSTICVII